MKKTIFCLLFGLSSLAITQVASAYPVLKAGTSSNFPWFNLTSNTSYSYSGAKGGAGNIVTLVGVDIKNLQEILNLELNDDLNKAVMLNATFAKKNIATLSFYKNKKTLLTCNIPASIISEYDSKEQAQNITLNNDSEYCK
jgi:hypothetical protein